MGISLTQLLIILAVVILLFGTKRLRNIGSDLGSAIKGFKESMGEGEKDAARKPDANTPSLTQQPSEQGGRIIDQTKQENRDEKKS